MRGKGRTAVLLLAMAAFAAGRQEQEDAPAMAARAMAEERYADAEALYVGLLREDPSNTGLLLNLGIARVSQGKYREAVDQFRTVAGKNPRAVPAWLLLGISCRNLNRAAEAVSAFEKLLELEPKNRTALAELAEALFSLGRDEQAAKRFFELSELEPANPRAWQGLGLSYLRLAQLAAAELEKAAPGSARWYVLRARERRGQGKAAQALALYRHALSLDPALRGIHAAIAGICRDSGQAGWAAAEEKREAALPLPDCTKETPECEYAAQRYWQAVEAAKSLPVPVAAYWRALSYRELADIAFARLMELPLSAELLERKAEMLESLRRHAEAAAVWQEALTLAPADAHLRRGLARSLAGAGDWPAVRAITSELLRQEPDSKELLALQGESLLALGDPQGAVAHLEKAGARSAALARAYLEAGQPERAAMVLTAAGDDDGSLHELLAAAYRAKGHTALARQAAARARQLSASPRAQATRLESAAEITAP